MLVRFDTNYRTTFIKIKKNHKVPKQKQKFILFKLCAEI